MIKVYLLLLAIAFASFGGYHFYTFINNDVFLTILTSLGLFIGFILAFVIVFFAWLFFATCLENKHKERVVQSKYYRYTLYKMDLLLFSLFNMRLHLSGIENLSKHENYVIVANHRSNLDSMIIDYYLKNFPLTFVAKDSLFKIPFVGKIIHGCAYLNLDRKNVNEEFKTISTAIDMLTREKKPLSIGIFPEGTRNKSTDNKDVQEFKAGSFRIAKKSCKPIAIMAIRGTKEVNNHLLFKKHDCYLDIIEVLEYEQYKDMDVQQIALYCENRIKTFLEKEIH